MCVALYGFAICSESNGDTKNRGDRRNDGN